MASPNPQLEPSPPPSVIQEPPPDPQKNSKKIPKPKRQKPPTPPQQKQKLYEQLGHEMVSKLVQDLQVPHDTPTLLDRLRVLGLISVQVAKSVPTSTTPLVTSASALPPPHPSLLKTGLGDQILQTGAGGALKNQVGNTIMPPTNIPNSNSNSTMSKKSAKSKDTHNPIFTLSDFAAVSALSTLTDTYGRVSHMTILDGTYTFFISHTLSSALCYKLISRICIVSGDPLCPPHLYPSLLSEFAVYRKKHNWGIIFIGASDSFLQYALSTHPKQDGEKKKKKWTTIQFGLERVLNPLTNPIIHETTKTAKRIVSQNRQLLHPEKHGLKIGIYNPSIHPNLILQAQLVSIYETWRQERNTMRKDTVQAFITVFDPFSIPGLMTYIYAMDREGTPIGFAALRRIGANNGFHIDPCISLSSAPRGVTDLLIFASLSLLNLSGCNYLTFGYEPLTESGRMEGMPKWLGRVTRRAHRGVYKGTKVGGKKCWHDKWYPDEELSGGLHIVFPDGVPGPQDMVAVFHFVHISVRGLVKERLGKMVRRKGKREEETKEMGDKVDGKAQCGVEGVVVGNTEGKAEKQSEKKKEGNPKAEGKAKKANRGESVGKEGGEQQEAEERLEQNEGTENTQKLFPDMSSIENSQLPNILVEMTTALQNVKPAQKLEVNGNQKMSKRKPLGKNRFVGNGGASQKGSMELAKRGAEGQVVEISVVV